MIQQMNLEPLVGEIKRNLESRLESLGFFYRIFARGKTVGSINHKLSVKDYDDCKKMQDIVGIRVVLYFVDDVEIVYQLLKSLENYVDESNSEKDIKRLDKEANLEIGSLVDKLFMPQRLNLIFRMSKEQTESLKMAVYGFDQANYIDNTYEVQIRTIFSEGWHEVEHDLRYKCREDEMWNYCKEESRVLNGFYASLETTECAMRSLFDNIAYKNLKHNNWSALLRNKLRIRFEDNAISDEIINILNNDAVTLGKEIYKYQRSDLFDLLKKTPGRMPRKMDNFIFLLNRATINNQRLIELEPAPITDIIKSIHSNLL